jgi:hypothetical protein
LGLRSQATGNGDSWNTSTPSLSPSPATAGRTANDSARFGSRKYGLSISGAPLSGARTTASVTSLGTLTTKRKSSGTWRANRS